MQKKKKSHINDYKNKSHEIYRVPKFTVDFI